MQGLDCEYIKQCEIGTIQLASERTAVVFHIAAMKNVCIFVGSSEEDIDVAERYNRLSY